MNTSINLIITYGSAIVFTWLGYLLQWLNFLAAVGITLVLLGLFGIASWLISYVNR